MERVVVFVDYRNVYYGARRAFSLGDSPGRVGHVDPFRLARLIASRGPEGSERVLQQVRVYHGVPSASKDARGHAAAWRQREAQRASEVDAQSALRKRLQTEYGYQHFEIIEHCHRTLHYPPDYPVAKPQEKGVDVQLAVDFVSGAFAHRFDVGIIFSTDTDLYPALEAVRSFGVDPSWPLALPVGVGSDLDRIDDYFVAAELVDSATRPRCEVAAWRAPDGHSPSLRLSRRRGGGTMDLVWFTESGEKVRRTVSASALPPFPLKLWCHWLDRADFDAVADATDYTVGDPPPSYW